MLSSPPGPFWVLVTGTKAPLAHTSLQFLPPVLGKWLPAGPDQLPLSSPESMQRTLLQVGVLGWGYGCQPRNRLPREVCLITSVPFPEKQARF